MHPREIPTVLARVQSREAHYYPIGSWAATPVLCSTKDVSVAALGFISEMDGLADMYQVSIAGLNAHLCFASAGNSCFPENSRQGLPLFLLSHLTRVDCLLITRKEGPPLPANKITLWHNDLFSIILSLLSQLR